MTTHSVSLGGEGGETSVESVEEDGEGGVGFDELFDEGEVKDVFEHCDIIFY